MLSNRGRRHLIYRMAALAILLAVYFTFDWIWLVQQLRVAVAFCLECWGNEVIFLGQEGISDTELLVENCLLLNFNVGCTYLHLTMFAIPFSWRFRRTFLKNCLTISLVGAGILLLNVVRVAAVTHMSCSGFFSWDVIHTAVDILAHLGIIISFVLMAIRYDLGTVPDTES